MNRIKLTPKNKRCSALFFVSKEEAEKIDLLKLVGPKAPAGLIDSIKDWIRYNRPGNPDTLPTHRLKKTWTAWKEIPVGTLFYVSKKKWIPPTWNWSDSGDVIFYKTRGHWSIQRMMIVDEKGNYDISNLFDYDETWGKEYLEPIRRKKEYI